ncbi:hypothetical protein [Photobacterium damselae]|uniref:Chemotaxis protein n=1 Tax=Photobacterium damselae TaxID=38293 RepID=A0ABD6WZW4_PHODM|nr:hypothetical protein [Photobacterium damselae]OBU38731.1 hypothetical protein AYY27_11180 [Photobacterium damselae]PSU15251.1 hypothetical protein CTM90_17350 [Photobacterium damselae]
MASNCKEFNYLIDRKQVYTSNDIPSLIAYNKCLVSEIDSLSNKVDKLDNANNDYKEKLSNLNIKIDSIKDLQKEKLQAFHSTYSEKLATLEATQAVNVNSYNSMFETSKSMYTDIITGIGLILGAASLLAIFSVAQYKKREIQSLIDSSLDGVKDKLEDEEYTQGLVSKALQSTFVGTQLDTELEKVASAVEQRVLNLLADREEHNSGSGSGSGSTKDTNTNQTTANALLAILKD